MVTTVTVQMSLREVAVMTEALEWYRDWISDKLEFPNSYVQDAELGIDERKHAAVIRLIEALQ